MVRTRDVTYEADAEAVNLVGHVIWLATTSYLLGAVRKCLTPSSGVRIVGDTKWISAIRQFAVEIHASEETVEIFVEADFETHAEERRRFAIINIPRHLFSEASGAAARRAATKGK